MTRQQQAGEDGGRDFEFWGERLRNATSRRTQRERERERERESACVALGRNNKSSQHMALTCLLLERSGWCSLLLYCSTSQRSPLRSRHNGHTTHIGHTTRCVGGVRERRPQRSPTPESSARCQGPTHMHLGREPFGILSRR